MPKKSLLTAFEKAEEVIQTNKGLSGEQKLTQIQQLRDEKKAFQEDGKLPTIVRVKTGVEAYQQAINAASKKMEKAFDVAIEGYVKLDDLEAAKAVLAEKKAVSDAKAVVAKKADPPAKKPDPTAPANLLGKWEVKMEGTSFRTEWTFKADGTMTSTEGVKSGKWSVDKDKKRLRIIWDGGEDLGETLDLPLDPKTTRGESHLKRALVAAKLKE